MKKNLLLNLIFISCVLHLNGQTTILDFETPTTSTTFQYFGSSLDATTNTIIANPDVSGINTSANVAEFVKPTGAQTWAGGFSDPNPGTLIDFTSDDEICLKVWTPQPITLLFKLEQSVNGFGNWENSQQITTTNNWVDVCYSALSPDDFGNGPAFGGIYSRIVLFFDFGVSPTQDMTYYFDDIVVGQGINSDVDVTFSVDMSDYTGGFSTVYVSGSFDGWSTTDNPLDDSDGDDIWTGTVTMPPGQYEYKFQLDGWAAQEDFSTGNYTCILTTVAPPNVFTNRFLSAVQNTSLPTVCYNSCYACGDALTLTVNLGEGNVTPDIDGFFIAGGGNFGNPGQFPLTDNDGDGVHSATFELPVGFQSYYTFTNGACGDYSCKEDLSGQPCADPANFDDRFMGPLNEDTTISTCFGICIDNTSCTIIVCEEEISYSVNSGDCDMTGATIELLDALGATINSQPLGMGGGSGSFGVQPCGDYSIAIYDAPLCYTSAGGNIGPSNFSIDGTGSNGNQFLGIPVEQVPTVGEWGLILLGLLLLIMAVLGIRQRQGEYNLS